MQLAPRDQFADRPCLGFLAAVDDREVARRRGGQELLYAAAAVEHIGHGGGTGFRFYHREAGLPLDDEVCFCTVPGAQMVEAARAAAVEAVLAYLRDHPRLEDGAA